MPLMLKGCKKCGGDLAQERHVGDYEEWICIQCGHTPVTKGMPVAASVRAPYKRGRTPPRDGRNPGVIVPIRDGKFGRPRPPRKEVA